MKRYVIRVSVGAGVDLSEVGFWGASVVLVGAGAVWMWGGDACVARVACIPLKHGTPLNFHDIQDGADSVL